MNAVVAEILLIGITIGLAVPVAVCFEENRTVQTADDWSEAVHACATNIWFQDQCSHGEPIVTSGTYCKPLTATHVFVCNLPAPVDKPMKINIG